MDKHQMKVKRKTERNGTSRKMNLQDVFLNHCRREKVDLMIQLLDQSIKTGEIVGFDDQSIILESDGRQYLIYKNAIVAVNPQEEVNYIFNESYRAPLNTSPEYSTDLA